MLWAPRRELYEGTWDRSAGFTKLTTCRQDGQGSTGQGHNRDAEGADGVVVENKSAYELFCNVWDGVREAVECPRQDGIVYLCPSGHIGPDLPTSNLIKSTFATVRQPALS